jgi:hypothetical protein
MPDETATTEATQRYGHQLATWEAAKAELLEVLIWHARVKDLPTYADLAASLKVIKFEPGSHALADLLTELSAAEDEAGHGLIAAIVVSKKTGRPGAGFLKQAQERGRQFDLRDPNQCEKMWRTEVTRVRESWKDLTL